MKHVFILGKAADLLRLVWDGREFFAAAVQQD
jgi:hypothetical protein